MKSKDAPKEEVTMWRILNDEGDELVQGEYLTIAGAWRDLGCTPECHRLQYLHEEIVRGRRVREWRATPLLPATAVLGE